MTTFIEGKADIWSPQIAGLMNKLGQVAYVAGGAARQLIMDEQAPEAEDIDIFLFEESSFEECCLLVRGLGYPFLMETENAAVFEPRNDAYEIPIQVIKPFQDEWSLTFGEPIEVLSRFSFTTEQFAIAQGKSIHGADAWRHTIDRQLVLNNITDPLAVAMRVAKYALKGYWIESTEMYKLFSDWQERSVFWRSAVAQAQTVAT